MKQGLTTRRSLRPFPRGKGRRLAAVLLAAALLAGCGGAASGENTVPARGEPVVSEASRAAATPLLDCLYWERGPFLQAVSGARDYEGEGRLVAGLVPHHLVAADMIAGFFAMAARQNDWDRVLILSPSHFPENCGSEVVTAMAGWDTPFGPAATDEAAVAALLENPDIGAENNPRAVELDHGAAGLVPFARYYLPKARVAVCLLSNRLPRQRLEAVWREVAELCADGRTLLVASADCSHYLTPEESARRDNQTRQAIEAADYPRILGFDDANLDSPQVVTALLEAVRRQEGELRWLDHSSSVDKLPQAIANPAYSEGITTYFVYGGFA